MGIHFTGDVVGVAMRMDVHREIHDRVGEQQIKAALVRLVSDASAASESDA